jgi:putative two-component system response regulator
MASKGDELPDGGDLEAGYEGGFGPLRRLVAQSRGAPGADDPELRHLPILAVDDEGWNLRLLERVLAADGYTTIETTTDPSLVPELFVKLAPALVVLDLHMPGMDGFELMERLGPLTGFGASVPLLVVTCDDSPETKQRALSAGARDFLTKPFDRTELRLRVRNLLQVQLLQARLHERAASLERQVAERTGDLEQARLEMLDRLALAAEYRDDATQEHARRIGRACAVLGAALGLPADQVELLRRGAQLHDIGKIGIPDAILLKHGRLSEREFVQLKRHTVIGAEILSGSLSPLLRLAEAIALTHHERWDGRGYPYGLEGEQIPLAGRIVAVADAFDALTHDRPYKPAWTIEQAVEEIARQRGRQFDGRVVDAFLGLDHMSLLGRIDVCEPRASEPLSAPAPSSPVPAHV